MKNIPPGWSIHRDRGDKVAFKPIGNLSFSVSFAIVIFVASTIPDVAIKDQKSCIKISGPCVVRDCYGTSVIPMVNPRILRRDEGKPPQPDYIQKGAWDCASKNRPEVGKRAQMWKDKQKVLEGQVAQVVAELTKVQSW